MFIECSLHVGIDDQVVSEFFYNDDVSVVILPYASRLYLYNGDEIIKKENLPNVTELEEDEFFQLSTAWDYPICIEVLKYLQKNLTAIIENNIHKRYTFELEIDIKSEL